MSAQNIQEAEDHPISHLIAEPACQLMNLNESTGKEFQIMDNEQYLQYEQNRILGYLGYVLFTDRKFKKSIEIKIKAMRIRSKISEMK